MQQETTIDFAALYSLFSIAELDPTPDARVW